MCDIKTVLRIHICICNPCKYSGAIANDFTLTTVVTLLVAGFGSAVLLESLRFDENPRV